jgi:hypothetical protein
MFLLGKVFTELPNIDILKRSIWLKNTTNLKFRAQVFLEHLSHSPLATIILHHTKCKTFTVELQLKTSRAGTPH